MKSLANLLKYILILILILNACDKTKDLNSSENDKYTGISEKPDPFQQNQLIGRSINLGNALEAPNEGDWGVTLQAEYFELIKNAGFNGVRIPIRWSAHAGDKTPYSIDRTFLSRIDWAISQAFNNDLAVILNIHHYNELMDEPEQHKDRFLAIWEQLSDHYQRYPKELFFEILNEPHNKLTPELWNEYLVQAINGVRELNPFRTLIIGTAEWGGIGALDKLKFPDDDNLIVTVHYYEPFHFTHQGASWVDGSNAWLGTQWQSTSNERLEVNSDLDKILVWATNQNCPVFLGEFGAYNKADDQSRYRWTSYVARQAEVREMSWAYWEFCAGFGIYDATTKKWNDLLVKALIP
ncbi:glycoside hydrolase family 5 protein [candidate division KSB1 bacterium]|nr:glycoside hydrolase family 5 protein [candidate division KSB1 bacterium]